jgi:hypothetical protein
MAIYELLVSRFKLARMLLGMKERRVGGSCPAADPTSSRMRLPTVCQIRERQVEPARCRPRAANAGSDVGSLAALPATGWDANRAITIPPEDRHTTPRRALPWP